MQQAVRRQIPSRSSPAVAAMPAPPAPPSALTGMGLPVSQHQILMSPHHLQAAGLHGHPGQIIMAGQPGLIPGQPGLIPGQPGLIQGHHPGLMQAHPGLIPGQPGLIPGQQALIPGQPGMIPGQAGLMPQLVAAGNPHMMLGAPNGIPRQALQMVQMPGLHGAGGMLRPSLAGLMAAQQRHVSPEQTHVPTAGYVANNVSGYTPANSAHHPPAGAQQLGQPIPIIANGVVVSSAAGAAAAPQQVLSPTQSQSLQAMAGLGAMPGGIAMSMAGMQQQMAAAAAAQQGAGGAGGGMPGLGIQAMAAAATPSMSGMMMAPSPAGAPAGAPQHAGLAMAAQPMFAAAQKLPAVQPGMVPAGALPMQNMAVAQTLKRQLPDPYAAAAILDKRIRLA